MLLFCPMADQYTLDDHEDRVELRTAWERVLQQLEGQVAETVLARFLKPLEPLAIQDDVASFLSPGRFVLEWVKEKYADRLTDELSRELGRQVRLELRVQAREKPSAVTASTQSVRSSVQRGNDSAKFQPNPRMKFDNFVVGQSNRLAFAGAKAIASSPGAKYNPLFIYGPPGLGKTHLLHAVANELLARDPGFPLVYVTAQTFAEEFIQALQENRIDRFRRLHRGPSVWLIDDVQFVAGKDKTQEELFHTFNYLHGIGRQIVLCSDRPPRDLLLMDERLRSRFESGLVADVQMPDTETRCAIVMKRAELEGIEISQDVAMVLATGVPGNVRILEGALTKLAAHASLDGAALDTSLAEEIIESYYAGAVTIKPSFEQILGTVSKHFQIEKTEITGTSRKAPVAHARHVAVYMTREILGDSWKHIGALFGNKDHTSMMHGYRKIREMMNRDRELNASIKMLIRDLYPEA
ncbi:chromosomal replication initiator protein DnaA [Kamptonema cortianum]|nr:chromosomal replication initiator protein DnaA [Geitlerinema splendidum]MDK3160992.1 chromosomal replication initiator protein DnaA [Kamptonema cortianum]